MSGGTRKQDLDLPTELHRWITQEMNFHSQGRHVNSSNLTPEKLKGITCGPMQDVWKFVLAHVRSAQTVKQVKGNLTLKGKRKTQYRVRYKSDEKFDSDKQDLLDKKAKLKGELTNVLTDINHLGKDLKRLQHDIEDTEDKYEKGCSEVDNLRRKGGLLQCYSQQCKETSQVYKEFSQRIDNRVDRTINRAKRSPETEYYSRKKSSTDEDHYSNTGLETKAHKQVRETCESVGKFLNTMLQGSFGTDTQALQRHKELLWNDVEKVLSDLSPLSMYDTLIVNTRDSTLALREATDRIDIRHDAEQIRFKYEKTGQLTDLSSPPSLLESVHQLIEETQMSQILRFVETEKYKNETWKKEQRLNDLKTKLDEKLQKTFSNPQHLKIARLYVDTEMELTGKRAALSCYIDEADILKEKVTKSLKDKEILMSKYKKIQDFQNIADKKQNLIRILIKQNANARSRLDEQQMEIKQYIQRSLLSHRSEVKTLTTNLHGSVASEIERFAGLHLPYLLLTVNSESLFRIAVIDLSINILSLPQSTSIGQSLFKVRQELGFHAYQSPELLLTHCMKEKEKVQEALSQLSLFDAQKAELRSASRDKDTVSMIIDLCKDVSEHDKKLLDKSLPVLQKRLDMAIKAQRDCINVKQAIDEWWNQPCQYLVPWVTFNNHNLQQWLDRWMVIVTSLRQLLVQKQ